MPFPAQREFAEAAAASTPGALNDDCVEIKNEENLLEWIDLNIEKGEVCIYAQIEDFDGPLQCSPTKHRCHPTVRSKVDTTNESPDIPLLEFANEKEASTSTKERAKPMKKTKKKRRDLHDEESVGVDEEGMYSDTDSLVAPSDSSYDTDLAASSDSDDDLSDPKFDPDSEIVDVDDVPEFSYDVDDPCIDVGVVFPDADQCQSVVTHWCIVNDHAYHTIKKDQDRFRADCKKAEKGCKWLFYASTSKKYLGTSCSLFFLLFRLC
ncbi:hypothetical protein EJB05_40390, partial [Eragrostis curvula]